MSNETEKPAANKAITLGPKQAMTLEAPAEVPTSPMQQMIEAKKAGFSTEEIREMMEPKVMTGQLGHRGPKDQQEPKEMMG